jgi:pilus assembly protein Flp/PilA
MYSNGMAIQRPKGNISEQEQIMIKSLKNFVANESGATAIEYALLASLIAVAIIASLNAVTTQLKTVFSEVSSALK